MEEKKVADFGQWSVYEWGIEGKLPEGCVGRTYDITKKQLASNDDWVRHMSEKNWVNLGEFTQALNYCKKGI